MLSVRKKKISVSAHLKVGLGPVFSGRVRAVGLCDYRFVKRMGFERAGLYFWYELPGRLQLLQGRRQGGGARGVWPPNQRDYSFEDSGYCA